MPPKPNTAKAELIAAAIAKGDTPAQICKKLGISTATFYYWKDRAKKKAQLEAAAEAASDNAAVVPATALVFGERTQRAEDFRETQFLREENARLKKQVRKLLALLLDED